MEKNIIGSTVEGNTKGKARAGAFEITDESGNCYYSKLETGSHITSEQLEEVVKAMKKTLEEEK